MKYKKIIPCLTMEHPEEEAKFYDDAGADAVAFFDSSATPEDLNRNVGIIRRITRSLDIPLIACGGIRNIEDVKKLLYAGAARICMKSAPLKDISIVRQCAERFGSERIVVTIDLDDQEDPVGYSRRLRDAGAGELLILNRKQREDYVEVVRKIQMEAALPVIVSSYSTDEDEISTLMAETNAEAISLYNLDLHDVMEIKQECRKKNVPVKVFESSLSFDDFKKDANGLVPCIAQDYQTGDVLMLAYMNEESFRKTLELGRMTYWSRSRQELWTKGETSGHYQFVKSLTIDCDKDTLLAKVSQIGAACHTGHRTCFFTPLVKKECNDQNPMTVFQDVYQTILQKKEHPEADGSYTDYLFGKGIDKILKKVGEQATDVLIAAKNADPENLTYEISDMLYHLMVLMAEQNLTWEDITRELSVRE